MEFLEGVWRSLTTADSFAKESGLRWKLLDQYGQANRYVQTYYLSRRGTTRSGMSGRTACLSAMPGGGTWSGALLGAHPNAILADEIDILKYLSAGFTANRSTTSC
jgi:hypothetical protein